LGLLSILLHFKPQSPTWQPLGRVRWISQSAARIRGLGAKVLSRRALNRATLARQLLLERSPLTPVEAVERLVGLQAQEPPNPYTALWSRLEGFRPEALAALLEERRVVRIPLMRSTIHLVSADDCLVLRPLMQPVLDAELARHRQFAPRLRDVDLEAVLAFARIELGKAPLSGTALRARLAARFPEHDAAALAYACRNFLALVQVPPRGLWGRAGQVRSTTVEAWIGRPLATRPSLDDVILRYFAAFGPAAVADVATWSRLTGLRAVVERLRPRLRTFRDERGRELFDLPDAPRPDPAVPAPPRFLPEYDNLLLSHDDRSRFIDADVRGRLAGVRGRIHGAVLSDGSVCGVWRLDGDSASGRATLVVTHVIRLSKRAHAAITAEGRRLLRLIAADASDHEVQVSPND
jgi:Winged helix DNA-binding domain